MATEKQREAARKNIKKAQAAWKNMTGRQHSLAQPEGRKRAKPGSTGEGEYYRIVVRPKEEFTSFRNQDVGEKGHLERLAGRRSSGSWATHAWLVNKADARIENGMLVSDDPEVKELLDTLRTQPKQIKADIFEAKDRRNVPESEKPTTAQKNAWNENIKKAQSSRRKEQ